MDEFKSAADKYVRLQAAETILRLSFDEKARERARQIIEDIMEGREPRMKTNGPY